MDYNIIIMHKRHRKHLQACLCKEKILVVLYIFAMGEGDPACLSFPYEIEWSIYFHLLAAKVEAKVFSSTFS